jgi:hypothetical protein
MGFHSIQGKRKKQYKRKERAFIQQCDNTLSIPCSKLGEGGSVRNYIQNVLFTPTHALSHTTIYQSFKLY